VPGRIVALNVATVSGDHRLAADVAGTSGNVFPQVLWQALKLNQLVLGRTAISRARLRAAVARTPARIRADAAARERARTAAPVPGRGRTTRARRVATDRMILEYAARGASLEERLLPTAP
jgi:hypothetical protein